jgi:hypothetical protein
VHGRQQQQQQQQLARDDNQLGIEKENRRIQMRRENCSWVFLINQLPFPFFCCCCCYCCCSQFFPVNIGSQCQLGIFKTFGNKRNKQKGKAQRG